MPAPRSLQETFTQSSTCSKARPMTELKKSQMRRIVELDTLRRNFKPGTREYRLVSAKIHHERTKFRTNAKVS